MGEDVPLTEFDSVDRDSGDDTATDDSTDESSEPTESADEPAETEPAETPSLTYTSSPDGATCAACGDTVEKRWRAGEGGVSADDTGDSGVDDPDALVCPDCKEW